MRVALISSSMAFASDLLAALTHAGFTAQHYEDGEPLLAEPGRPHFDLLLIDGAGLSRRAPALLHRLRDTAGFDPALILFNCPDSEALLADAFALGADDFIRRDTRLREVLARVEAVLRRRNRSQHRGQRIQLNFAPYAFDLDARVARLHEAVVPLTEKEFDLTVLLFRNVGRLLSRDRLLAAIWRSQNATLTRTVDTHVSRIRRRLMLDARHGYRLASAYGEGYRLDRVHEPRVLSLRNAGDAPDDDAPQAPS